MTIVDKNQRWWLGNAEERESETFQIPSREEREQLRPTDVAKLLFEFPSAEDGCNGERMWVQVTQVEKRPEGPLYMGKLSNDPVYLDDVLKDGDPIVFGPEHVTDWDSIEP